MSGRYSGAPRKSASPVVSVCVYIKQYPKMRTQTHHPPKKERMLSTRMNCQQTARYNCCRWIASDAIQYLFSLFANCFYAFPFPVVESVCVCVRVFYLSPKVKCLLVNGVRFSRIIESMWGSFRHVSLSLSSLLSRYLCMPL